MAGNYGFISDELDAISDMLDICKEKGDTIRSNELLKEKIELQNQLEKQKGVDDEIIGSIDLSFKKPTKVKNTLEADGIGWKELTIAILIVALIAFFISERRRFS